MDDLQSVANVAETTTAVAKTVRKATRAARKNKSVSTPKMPKKKATKAPPPPSTHDTDDEDGPDLRWGDDEPLSEAEKKRRKDLEKKAKELIKKHGLHKAPPRPGKKKIKPAAGKDHSSKPSLDQG